VDPRSRKPYFWRMGSASVAAAFGRVLRDVREKSGLSQETLAGIADIDRTYVSLLERGLRQPTLETLFRLSQALDISPATMVSRTVVLVG
jgi:transcriptional regulator with XRE-family HTH domain